VRNPLRSEADAFRFLLLTIGYFALIVIGAIISTWLGLVVFVVLTLVVLYVAFIRGVLGHLRHVMIFLALSFSLVLISLNIYSFEPHQSLIWSFTVIFVVTGFMVIGVLVQLHRDPILSRVTGTTGNALDLHFYLRLFAFGAVPLLTLLATHFPSIGHYLLSFLRPSLEALK